MPEESAPSGPARRPDRYDPLGGAGATRRQPAHRPPAPHPRRDVPPATARAHPAGQHPPASEEDPLTSQTPAQRLAPEPLGLRLFNRAGPGTAEQALLACCGSRRWAVRLAAHRPYPTVESLLAAASEACYDLGPADLAEALAEEESMPRPPLGTGPAGSQAARTALRAAHTAYEARFGHAFVLGLDGVPEDEVLDTVLASLRARLTHEPEEERLVSADQLRRVALARLRRLVSEAGGGGAAGR